MLKVIPFIYNDIDEVISNTYIVIDEKNCCVVIDPSVNNDGICNYILKNKLRLKGILITHTHFDHIRGVDRLVSLFKCPLYVGEKDIIGLTNAKYNGSIYMNGVEINISSQAEPLFDSDVINLISEPIKVIFTPYHTKGGVCYYLKDSKMLFSGDSLFQYSIGRTDLFGSSPREMNDSLRKLMLLPNDVKVYPGHGSFTSIGEERNKNTFIKML